MISHTQTSKLLRSQLGICLLFLTTFVAVLYVYRNSYEAPFTLDDETAILKNRSIRHLCDIKSVLSPPRNTGIGGRPLVNLTYAINYAMSGTAPWSYHVADIGIHLAAGLFLFLILRNILKKLDTVANSAVDRGWVAWVVTALWLLHPIQTESIVYISQRTECMAALCYLVSFYLFTQVVDHPEANRFKIGSVAMCGAGMLCKETMVTAPVFFYIFDAFIISGSFASAWRLRRELYVSLACTWILLGLSVFDLSKRSVGYGQGFSIWTYPLLESKALYIYVLRTIWPFGFVFDYGSLKFPELPSLLPYIGLCVVALALTILGLIRRWKGAFLSSAFFILLAPSSSIVPVAMQPIAEHRMYLPSACLILGIVLVGYKMMGRKGLAGFGLVAIGLGFLTSQRVEVYRTPLSLWSDTVSKTSENSRALANLGMAYTAAGHSREGEAFLRRALLVDRRNDRAQNALGNIWYDSENYAAAADAFRQAIALAPGQPEYYANFGNAALHLGRTEQAISSYRSALLIDPGLPEVHHSLGCALASTGNFDAALLEFKKALELNPDFQPAREAVTKLNMGSLHTRNRD